MDSYIQKIARERIEEKKKSYKKYAPAALTATAVAGLAAYDAVKHKSIKKPFQDAASVLKGVIPSVADNASKQLNGVPKFVLNVARKTGSKLKNKTKEMSQAEKAFKREFPNAKMYGFSNSPKNSFQGSKNSEKVPTSLIGAFGAGTMFGAGQLAVSLYGDKHFKEKRDNHKRDVVRDAYYKSVDSNPITKQMREVVKSNFPDSQFIPVDHRKFEKKASVTKKDVKEYFNALGHDLPQSVIRSAIFATTAGALSSATNRDFKNDFSKLDSDRDQIIIDVPTSDLRRKRTANRVINAVQSNIVPEKKAAIRIHEGKPWKEFFAYDVPLAAATAIGTQAVLSAITKASKRNIRNYGERISAGDPDDDTTQIIIRRGQKNIIQDPHNIIKR